MGTKNKNPKGQGMSHEDPGKFFASVKKGWKKLRKGQKTAIICAAAFLVLIGTGIWFYASVLDNPDGVLGRPENPIFEPEGEGAEISEKTSDEELDQYLPQEYFDSNIINFALLGFDTNEERRDMEGESWYGLKGFQGARPDSIRVVSVNLDTMKASVISIPRDIYVKIADTSTKEKINSSYYFGRTAGRKISNDEKEINKMGMQYVCQSISNVLGGVPIDYYMAIDFDTVVKFVDAIGGVDYYVEQNIYQRTDGQLMLEKGQQTLNGTQVFIYLQDRFSVGSDIVRTGNHTKFLLALVKQLKQTDKLVEAIKFITMGGLGTVDTNMTAREILATGNLARKLSMDEDVSSYIIEGRGQMMDGISYLTIDQAKRAEIIKAVFGFEIEPQENEKLQDTVPAPPTNFTASVTADGVVLDWAPGDTHNRGYNVFRNGELIAGGITEDMYLDGEYPSGALTYEVQAVNGDAVSEKVSVAAVQAGPAAPTNFKAEYDEDEGVVKLTWDYPGDDVSFTIYKSDGDGSGRRLESGIKGEHYTDNDIEADTTYTYFIVAVDDGEESGRVKAQVTIGTAPTVQRELKYAINPSGIGVISCSGDIDSGDDVPSGTEVTLTAPEVAGYTFDGWSGSGLPDGTATGSRTLKFKMPAEDVKVTANYTAPTPTGYMLTMAKGGAGTGNVSPGTSSQTAGVAVNITATPTGGSTFGGWTVTSGSATFGNANNASTTVTASANCTIRATFNAPPATTYTLTMAKAGTGNGELNPGTSSQTAGVAVNISATPDGSSTFAGWAVTSGTATFGDAGSASTTVTASADCTITATFNTAAPTTYTVNITVDPAGAGSTTGQGSDKSGSVAISANANTGYVFSHWGGADAGKVANVNSASTTVTVDKNISITAVFSESGGEGGGGEDEE